VKPFVKRSKNDRNDAEAISVAASQPSIGSVPVKSVEAGRTHDRFRTRSEISVPAPLEPTGPSTHTLQGAGRRI
jgi:hypothetical protein